jgi:hypothetical protein
MGSRLVVNDIYTTNTVTCTSLTYSPTGAEIYPGLVKVWFEVAAAGTLNDDYGVSSLDDDGQGDRGVNLSTSMSGATNYAVLLSTDDASATTSWRFVDVTNGTKVAGAFDFECNYGHQTLNRTSIDMINWGGVHGNLG